MAAARDTVLVLGADAEGLAAAAHLARAGRRVVVIDGAARAGGIHAEHELHPGFVAGSLLHEAGLVPRALLAPLDLERHGLAWRTGASRLVVPREGGGALSLSLAPRRLDGLPGEAQAFERWSAFVGRLEPLVRGLVDGAPPELGAPSPLELLELARRALALRSLGSRFLEDLLRIAPSSAADWLGDSFAEPALKSALAAPALIGTVCGPRAPSTSALILLRAAALGPEPEGGLAALARALEAAARAAGAEIRLGVAPRRILTGAAGVEGLELADGTRLEGAAVLSALGPKRTLLELLPAGTLPPSLETAVRTFRTRGAAASLRLALARAPRFVFASTPGAEAPGASAAGGAAFPERVLSARSLDELERASDPWKYGEIPALPWLDLRLEPARAGAPAGGVVLSALAQGVPSAARGGWNEAERTRLLEALFGALERVAPGVRADVLAHELCVPPDLERRFSLDGGHLLGGEIALDQLLVSRPCLAFARHRTSVPGLVLGSSGSHPGGAFVGGAGSLAARALLA